MKMITKKLWSIWKSEFGIKIEFIEPRYCINVSLQTYFYDLQQFNGNGTTCVNVCQLYYSCFYRFYFENYVPLHAIKVMDHNLGWWKLGEIRGIGIQQAAELYPSVTMWFHRTMVLSCLITCQKFRYFLIDGILSIKSWTQKSFFGSYFTTQGITKLLAFNN